MKSEKKEIDSLLAALARAGRLGDYGDANRDLNRCMLLIQHLQACGAMKPVPQEIIGKFNYSLETIFMMLGNKDWVAIADIIEYELLSLWREMAKRL